jgi:hypothetical protein
MASFRYVGGREHNSSRVTVDRGVEICVARARNCIFAWKKGAGAAEAGPQRRPGLSER